MKVKDMITMLQSCNPESHLRGPLGVITFLEEKEGYWDGAYDYIDEDGNWVKTTKGSKVDIHCMEYLDHVEKICNAYYKEQDGYFIPDFNTFFNTHCRWSFSYTQEEQNQKRGDAFKKAYYQDFKVWVEVMIKYNEIEYNGFVLESGSTLVPFEKIQQFAREEEE